MKFTDAEDDAIMFDQITLYANEAEKKQHNNAIRLLCEELSENEAVIRPIYEEIRNRSQGSDRQ